MNQLSALVRLLVISLTVGVVTGCIRPEQPVVATSTVASEATALCSPTDQIACQPSPDGQWTAEINGSQGTLLHQHATGKSQALFPTGTTISNLSWSPDSHTLIAVRDQRHTNSAGEVQVDGLPQLWQVNLTETEATSPTLVFDTAQTVPNLHDMGPGQLILGDWSPDNQHLFFWVGPLSASILADGLPFVMVDTAMAQSTLLSDATLLNSRYHSWAPDGTALVFTDGSYRSAQVQKWLSLWDSRTNQVTTVISQTEQIPGIVAWSPKGDWIAYAAVPAAETGPEWADLMTFDNPAIAGRRIYLLDPTSGDYHQLNDAESFQDAPVWSADGTTLYYVQRDGDEMLLMAADPTTGQGSAMENTRQPLPDMVGYYGQGEWEQLLKEIPDQP